MNEPIKLSNEEKVRRFDALRATLEAWHYIESEIITDGTDQFHKDCTDAIFEKLTDCAWLPKIAYMDPPSRDEETKMWIHNLFLIAYNSGKDE